MEKRSLFLVKLYHFEFPNNNTIECNNIEPFSLKNKFYQEYPLFLYNTSINA